MEQLKPYHAHKEEMIKINKGKRFQQAVDAVEDYLKKAKGKEQVIGKVLNFLSSFVVLTRSLDFPQKKDVFAFTIEKWFAINSHQDLVIYTNVQVTLDQTL